jgi:hypothetical protein
MILAGFRSVDQLMAFCHTPRQMFSKGHGQFQYYIKIEPVMIFAVKYLMFGQDSQ